MSPTTLDYTNNIILPLLSSVGADHKALGFLADVALDSSKKEVFAAYISQRYMPATPSANNPAKVYESFLHWCGQHPKSLSFELQETIRKIRNAKHKRRSKKKDFVASSRINWTKEEKQEFLQSLDTYTVERLKTPFPLPNTFVLESEFIRDTNHHFLVNRNMSDKRTKRRPMVYPAGDLALDIGPTQSGLIYARQGKKSKRELVAVVIREACGNEKAVEAVDNTIAKAIDVYSTCRVCKFIFLICILCDTDGILKFIRKTILDHLFKMV